MLRVAGVRKQVPSGKVENGRVENSMAPWAMLEMAGLRLKCTSCGVENDKVSQGVPNSSGLVESNPMVSATKFRRTVFERDPNQYQKTGSKN